MGWNTPLFAGPVTPIRCRQRRMLLTCTVIKNMPETLDLFPDHPAPVPGSMMELVAMPGIKLSPAQRTFKRLVADVEASEKKLRELGELLDMFRPRFSAKLNPLQDERDTINHEMALFLDEKLQRKGWTANQRKTMRDLLCEVAEMLFGSAYHDEMVALFDRHSEVTLADMAVAEKKAFAENGKCVWHRTRRRCCRSEQYARHIGRSIGAD